MAPSADRARPISRRRHPRASLRVLVAWFVLALVASRVRAADGARDKAEAHYRTGLSLFDGGNREQALIEFQIANQLSPSPDAVFMMAQCEYHLGELRAARDHYQTYLDREPQGALAATAQLRIEAIDRRPSVVVINTVPDSVDVTIEGPGGTFTGQAPNEFRVPRGHYRVTVAKTNHVTQTREIDLSVAETRPLFFKLDPVPARLEIHTSPPGATLYVRGNRAENPYLQLVEPGSYELYAEATDYQSRRDSVTVAAGERRAFDFRLKYVQRSGRPELIWFSTAVGAVAGSVGVLARLEAGENKPKPGETTTTPGDRGGASISLIVAGGTAFAIGGALVSTALVPRYIRDNLALYRIGAMWIGAAEGALTGLAIHRLTSDSGPTSTAGIAAAWMGGALGLGAGTVGGIVSDDRAPNYGRVALIQSAAAWGGVSAAFAVRAFDISLRANELTLLAGVNLGLGAGLAMAYLPDQSHYGPTWQHVMLVNLAGLAGGAVGALVPTLATCIATQSSTCGFDSNEKTTRFALGGAAIGLLAGWALTRGYDPNEDRPLESPRRVPVLPAPAALPVSDRTGHTVLVPGLAANGQF